MSILTRISFQRATWLSASKAGIYHRSVSQKGSGDNIVGIVYEIHYCQHLLLGSKIVAFLFVKDTTTVCKQALHPFWFTLRKDRSDCSITNVRVQN